MLSILLSNLIASGVSGVEHVKFTKNCNFNTYFLFQYRFHQMGLFLSANLMAHDIPDNFH